MDKNTLLGLLLMAACLFGFMYFNKPSEEELARRKAEQEQLAARQEAADETAIVTFTDSLTQSDGKALAAAVSTAGNPDGKGGYTLVNEIVSLSADSTGINGTIKAASTDIDVSDVLSNRFGSLSPEQRTDAVANVRKTIAQVQKYKSFARHLSGANDSVTIENDLMKVTFATRGGIVSQV